MFCIRCGAIRTCFLIDLSQYIEIVGVFFRWPEKSENKIYIARASFNDTMIVDMPCVKRIGKKNKMFFKG